MKRIDVSVGKRVQFNGRIRECWWFKPGQTGTVTGFNSDVELPIDVLVDCDGGIKDVAHVHADMIDPVEEQGLLEQIAADVKRLLAWVEKQEHESDRKAWMRGMGV